MIEYELTQQQYNDMIAIYLGANSHLPFTDFMEQFSGATKYYAFRMVLTFEEEKYLNWFLLKI